MREFGNDFDDKRSNFHIELEDLRKRVQVAYRRGVSMDEMRKVLTDYINPRIKYPPIFWDINKGYSIYDLNIPIGNQRYFVSDLVGGHHEVMMQYYVEACLNLGLSSGTMDNLTYLANIMPVISKAFSWDPPYMQGMKRAILLHNINKILDLDSHIIKTYNKMVYDEAFFVVMQGMDEEEPFWQIVDPTSCWRIRDGEESELVFPNYHYIDQTEKERLEVYPEVFECVHDASPMYDQIVEALEEIGKPDATITSEGWLDFSVENIRPIERRREDERYM